MTNDMGERVLVKTIVAFVHGSLLKTAAGMCSVVMERV